MVNAPVFEITFFHMWNDFYFFLSSTRVLYRNYLSKLLFLHFLSKTLRVFIVILPSFKFNNR